MAKKSSAQKLYDWGDGRKVHTIPKAQSKQNREAQSYGINLNQDVSAPLTNRGAYGLAQQQADLQYKPQIQANQTLQRSVPEWYANYQAQVAATQAANQAYAAPLLQQAQQGVQNAGAGTPGLDPTSAQYGTDQQAAKGRQSIAQLGYDTLAAVPAAANAYFGGQASIAARELPGVQAGLVRDYGSLQGQRGQAVAANYGQVRGQEQNAQIAYGTLGLNQDKARADVDLDRGVDPVTGKALPKDAPTGYGAGGPGQNKYGYTYDEWSSLTPAQQAKERKGSDTSAVKAQEKQQKETLKKKAAIDKATGKIRNKVTDIAGEWERGGTVTETDAQGIETTRKATPKELRSAIVEKYGYLGRIALAIREGRPLDQKAQDYLHNLNQDFRIPREWIGKSKKGSSSPVAAVPGLGDVS